jgi:cytochrome c biogenesis factor
VTLRVGETLAWDGYTVRLVQLHQRPLPEKLVVEAELQVQCGTRHVCTLWPAQHFHFRQHEWTTEISRHVGWTGDFYTILHSGDGGDAVNLTLIWNPMMCWIWLGGWIMGSGALAAVWPKRQPALVQSALPSRPAAIGRRERLSASAAAGATITARVRWRNV